MSALRTPVFAPKRITDCIPAMIPATSSPHRFLIPSDYAGSRWPTGNRRMATSMSWSGSTLSAKRTAVRRVKSAKGRPCRSRHGRVRDISRSNVLMLSCSSSERRPAERVLRDETSPASSRSSERDSRVSVDKKPMLFGTVWDSMFRIRLYVQS